MTAPSFTVHPTPVGDVLIVVRAGRLIALHPLREPIEAVVARLAATSGEVPVEKAAKPAATAAHQLDEYFAGRRREFRLSLEWDGVSGFFREALQAVCRIPYGETAGYGEVAAMAGHPRAARAVGTACATTPFSIVVPVHRVVRADGSLGDYGGRPEIKAHLLEMENTVAATGVYRIPGLTG